jgi:hypothetical protein
MLSSKFHFPGLPRASLACVLMHKLSVMSSKAGIESSRRKVVYFMVDVLTRLLYPERCFFFLIFFKGEVEFGSELSHRVHTHWLQGKKVVQRRTPRCYDKICLFKPTLKLIVVMFCLLASQANAHKSSNRKAPWIGLC